MPDHALGRLRIEQIRAVLQGAAKARLALLEVEHEVEARGAHGDVERARRETRQIDLSNGIVEKRQHRLEDRRTREVSLWNDVLDHLLERDVLMRVRLDGSLSNTSQHLLERRVARKIDPQRQGVHEEPDQPVELGLACGSRSGIRRRCRPVRCAARAGPGTRP